MDEEIKVTCPCCKNILIIQRATGKLLETRAPILEDSTGDRFLDAFEKVRRSKDVAENKFLEAKEKEKGKMARLESLFEEGLKRAKESGSDHRPVRDIDLD